MGVKDKMDKFRDDMDKGYANGSRDYAGKSDEQLQREYKRQLDRPTSGDKFGRMSAIKDEYDSRH